MPPKRAPEKEALFMSHRAGNLNRRKLLVSVLLLVIAGCAHFEPLSDTTMRPEAVKVSVAAARQSEPPRPGSAGRARPDLYVPFLDPTFGTTMMRVTDARMAPAEAGKRVLGLRHEYSRFPVLNATNTEVALQVLGGADRGAFEIRELTSGKLLH